MTTIKKLLVVGLLIPCMTMPLHAKELTKTDKAALLGWVVAFAYAGTKLTKYGTPKIKKAIEIVLPKPTTERGKELRDDVVKTTVTLTAITGAYLAGRHVYDPLTKSRK